MKIRLLNIEGQSALVEWIEDEKTVRRGYIPAGEIKEEQVDQELLNAAIPYGDFFAVSAPAINAEMLTAELHRQGIWLKDEVITNPGVVIAVLQRLYGLEYATLVKQITEEVK